MNVYTGRKVILTTVREITPDNVCAVLNKALAVHRGNAQDIDYLYSYYKGRQSIIDRVKLIRPDICYKVVENHADEIVSFKTGYLFGDPVVYSGRAEDDCAEEIQQLNAWNFENNTEALNVEVGTWMHICGTAYKIAIPGDPYITDVLDPREAFVVYYNGIPKVPVMGVKIVNVNEVGVDYTSLYCVYTDKFYFEIPNTLIGLDTRPVPSYNPMGMVPIIEYPLNMSRRGSIEVVLPLLEALNELASNRMDGIAQYIQSLLLFHNVDVSEEDVQKLKDLGAIKYKDAEGLPGDVKYITAELNQEGAQTLKDDLYKSVLVISGMPNRNDGAGDNGLAVIYRDGYTAAEAKAKETEKYFKRSERELLKVILNIVRAFQTFDCHLSNIDITFTRKNYDNTATKATVLTQMLGCDKIAPRLAFVKSGMFEDPDAAWKESEEYVRRNPQVASADVGGSQNSPAGTEEEGSV